jgi:hypothetical protein
MPVFDQGYQHWSGALSGHAWRWLTITRHGVRIGMKNVFLRLVVIAAWVPAVFMAFILCLWGMVEQKSALVQPFLWVLAGLFPAEVLQDPKNYRVEVWTVCYHFFLQAELYLSMIVVLLVGPNLISQDLRFNALQLYFARPLRRIDYFVGKLGVIGWFLSMVIILPSLIAYVLGLLFSLDITIVRHLPLVARLGRLWVGGRPVRRDTHAGAVVADAQLALRRSLLARPLVRHHDHWGHLELGVSRPARHGASGKSRRGERSAAAG